MHKNSIMRQTKQKNQNNVYGAFNVHIVVMYSFCGPIEQLGHLFTCTLLSVDVHSFIVCVSNALLFNQPHYFYIKIGMCATVIIDVQYNIKVYTKSISNRTLFRGLRPWLANILESIQLVNSHQLFLHCAYFLTIFLFQRNGSNNLVIKVKESLYSLILVLSGVLTHVSKSWRSASEPTRFVMLNVVFYANLLIYSMMWWPYKCACARARSHSIVRTISLASFAIIFISSISFVWRREKMMFMTRS